MTGVTSAQKPAQPVYLLCDTSHHGDGSHLTAANEITAHLADIVVHNVQLVSTVRLSVLEMVDDRVVPLIHLSRVDDIDQIPALTAVPGAEVSLSGGLAELGRVIQHDLSQIAADGYEIHSPLVVLVTAGQFSDDADARRSALAEFSRPDRFSPPRPALGPTVHVFSVAPGHAREPIASLASPLPQVVDVWLEPGEVPVQGIQRILDEVAHSLRTGIAARWVVLVSDLGRFEPISETPDAFLSGLPGYRLPAEPGPLQYAEFTDISDAEIHPYDDLLRVLRVRDRPAGPDGHLTDRTSWPVRLVVASDNPDAVRGLVVPSPREEYHGGPFTGLEARQRAALGRELAAVVDLAHQYGAELGPTALGSAGYVLEPEVRVHLSRCELVRVPEGKPDHTPDLELLAGQIAALDHHDVLDDLGRTMLAEARSGVPRLVPRALEWRQYLDRRFIALQGLPVVTDVQVTPSVAVADTTVTVRWRCRYADRVSVIGPDGLLVGGPPGALDEGEVSLPVRVSGPVRVRAENQAGIDQAETGSVHVFGLPTLTRIEIPTADVLRLDLDDPALRRIVDVGASSAGRLTEAALISQDAAGGRLSPPFDHPASTVDDPLAGLSEGTTFPMNVIDWFAAPPQPHPHPPQPPPASRRRWRWWRR